MSDAQEEQPTDAPEEQAPQEVEQTEKEPEAEQESAVAEEEQAAAEDVPAEVADAPAEDGETTETPAEVADEAGEQEAAEQEAQGDSTDAAEQEAESAEQPAAESSEAVDVDAQPAADGEPSEQAEGVEPSAGGEADEAGEASQSVQPDGEGEEKTEGAEATDGAENEGGEDGAEVAEGEGGETSEPTEGEEKPEGEEGDEGPKPEGEGEAIAVGGEGEGEGEAVPTEEAQGEEGQAEVTEEGVGERAESPVGVGEKLSREATPEAEAISHTDQERLEATTPDRLDGVLEEEEGQRITEEGDYVAMVPEEEEEDVVEDVPQFRRDELIEKYHEALAEREQLTTQNYALQHKLAEYFRKKKADERQDYDKNVTDQEQRYLKYMAQLEELRRQDAMEKENYRAQIEDAKERCQEKNKRVDLERKKFMEFKKQVALNAINSRSGKPIPPKDIEQYMANEVRKEQEVINVRLENIKLKNKLKKKEQQLKSKEELAEGLHLIDFEQLKIENQTYNEKIEERNEELLKLRKKITGTVQVLTHLKEKLQFVQGENLEQNNQLKEVESALAQSRDILSRTKQARDALRIDNQRLRQNCGLLGNEPLLRDFEERKDESDDLDSKLEQLKMRHAELTLHCNQVRRKIDQARQGMN